MDFSSINLDSQWDFGQDGIKLGRKLFKYQTSEDLV